MGKRVEDLDLDDVSFIGTPEQVHAPTSPDRTTHAAAIIDQIDRLLSDGRYEWAETTLLGIHDTVSRSGRASAAQQQAVDNIERAGERSRRWRRY